MWATALIADSLSVASRFMPYWWETLSFRGGVGLFALAALAFGYRWRVSALHRRRAEQDRFARRLLESQEAERQRIANELHDGIGQALVVIRNRALLGVTDGAAPLDQLDEISAAAAEAIEDVRNVAYGLRPYQLDHLGLTRALQSLVERTASSSGIDLRADVVDLDGVFRSEDEINVYRIVQEAVSNMVRHSHARRGSASVSFGEHEIEIRIEDDGTGFDPSAPSSRGGLGLSGFGERARILGGRHLIRSAAGHGTTVIVRVPRSRRP
jgi:signal transduction histidine kinase